VSDRGDVIGVPRAGRLLRAGRSKVEDYIRLGLLRTRRVNGDLRVMLADVLKLREQRRALHGDSTQTRVPA
jgi:hypothetical protein